LTPLERAQRLAPGMDGFLIKPSIRENLDMAVLTTAKSARHKIDFSGPVLVPRASNIKSDDDQVSAGFLHSGYVLCGDLAG
jgi:hypothetical protein